MSQTAATPRVQTGSGREIQQKAIENGACVTSLPIN